jgi:hypothetical protein
MNTIKEGGDGIAVVCPSKNRSDGRIDIDQDSGLQNIARVRLCVCVCSKNVILYHGTENSTLLTGSYMADQPLFNVLATVKRL